MQPYFEQFTKYLLFIIVFSTDGYAQPVNFTRYTTEDGLPHNVGYDILQDHGGFLWIGTDNGLARFNGSEFKTYGMEDGLLGPYVISLSESADSSIWLGVYKKGIQFIKNDSLHVLSVSPKPLYAPKVVFPKRNKLLINDIGAKSSGNPIGSCDLREGSDGFRFRLIRVDNKSSHIYAKPFQIDALARSNPLRNAIYTQKAINTGFEPAFLTLFQRKSGEILVGSSIGLLKYINDSTYVRFTECILPNGEVTAISEDGDARLWVVIENELIGIFEKKIRKTYRLPVAGQPFIQIRVTLSGLIYALAEDRKTLIRLNQTTGVWEDLYPSMGLETGISFIELDKDENLWLTTNGEGLFCIYKPRFQNFNEVEQLPSLFISSINQDPSGNLYAGTQEGLSVLNADFVWEPVREIQNLKINGILNMNRMDDGTLLICTEAGFIWKALRDTWTHPPFLQWHIYTIWNMNPAQVSHLDLAREDRIRDSLDNLPEGYLDKKPISFTCIASAPNKQIFVGTSDGVYITRPDMFLLDTLTTRKGLPHPQVNDIRMDKEGRCWLATEGGFVLWEGDKFQIFDKSIGLQSNSCNALCPDPNGGMWVGTAKGLYLFKENKLRPYSTRDGLIAEDINCIYVDDRERVWIGTSRGISLLKDPGPDIGSPPKPYQIGLLENDSKVPPHKYLDLNRNSFLEFRVGIVSFRPEELRSQYRIRTEDPWQPTKEKDLRFNRLIPGDYQFQFRSRHTNSEWSEPLVIPFSIASPWWQETPYLILWTLMLIGLVLMGIWLQTQRIKRKEAEKFRINRQIAELELEALQAQINPHFIFNIIGAIQHFIIDKDTRAANTYLVEFAALMRMFLESSKEKFLPLEEEIRLIETYIKLERMCYEDAFTYEVYHDKEVNPKQVQIPSMLIQPFVENAIHHGLLYRKNPGHLKVDFRKQGGFLYCEIEDNGIGRKQSGIIKEKSLASYKSRGVKIIEERLRVLTFLGNESLSIDIEDLETESHEAAGTRVHIRIPLQTLSTI